MQWTVKKDFFKHKLYQNGLETGVSIKQKGTGFLATDENDTMLLRIDETMSCRFRITGSDTVGDAALQIAAERPLVLPPRAERGYVNWNNCHLVLQQLSDRQIHVFLSEKLVGTVTGVLDRVTTLSLPEFFSKELVALCYVLAFRMCIEDVIDIV